MIRTATAADRMAMVRLMRDAHAAAPAMPFGFSAPHALSIVDRHIGTATMMALLYAPEDRPQGILLAAMLDHPFAAVPYAMETVWWIAAGARGRAAVQMLDAYEAWATDKGCVFAAMAALASFPRAGVIYERRGYLPIETHYLKPLALAASA